MWIILLAAAWLSAGTLTDTKVLKGTQTIRNEDYAQPGPRIQMVATRGAVRLPVSEFADMATCEALKPSEPTNGVTYTCEAGK
jgi:hypothetical protein